MNSLQLFLIFLPGFVIGLTFHEFSHAYAAYLLGDSYPASRGRLTLNPLAHLSPLGTLALIFFNFGWARPVMVNPYNFKRPRIDMLLTSLAGPLANLLLMSILILVLRTGLIGGEFATLMILYGAIINAVLAVFNLLPIPPLDGSRIWPVLFPNLRLAKLERYSLLWIALLFIAIRMDVLSNIFGAIISVVINLSGLQ
jgi:Zn-dependent protease